MRRLAIPFGLVLAFAAFLACSSDDEAAPSTPSDDGGGATTDATPEPDGGGDGGLAPPTVFMKSGTRLAIESMRVDGLAFFRRFVDKKLGTPCELRPTGDASAVCVPISAALVYSDPACTAKAALRVTCNPEVKYAVDAKYTCNVASNVVVYPLGAATAGTTFYEGADCSSAPVSAGDLLSLGAPIPQSELVSFTLKLESATPELQRARWVGSDGSELVDAIRLADTTRDAGCQAAYIGLPDAGGGTRCLPPRRAVHRGGGGDGPFSEATCTAPLADYGSTDTCGPPQIALQRRAAPDAGAGSCAPTVFFTAHALGASAPDAFTKAGVACNPESATASRTFWSIGAELSGASYPELVQTVFGTTRVRTQALASKGVQLFQGGAFDTVHGVACSAMKLGAGTYCVNEVPDPYDLFEDAACTKPIVLGSSCGSGPQAATIRQPRADGCGDEVTEVHSVTPLAITEVYRKDGATCTAEPLQSVAYAVGPVVDPATIFPKVDIVTE